MSTLSQPTQPPENVAAPAEVSVEAAPPRPHRAWDDVPMQNKMGLLLVLAAVGGSFIGVIETSMGHQIWPLIFGLTALVITLLALQYHWFWLPLERLLRVVNRLGRQNDPRPNRSLPIEREDELGQIARAMHQIAVVATRDRNEARQLRRTLDDRIAHATRKATRHLTSLALHDSLTNLANRRYLEQQLQPLIEQARQTQQDLLCVLIDMDNFKQVNDTLGHSVGDELLVFLSDLIRANIRKSDHAIRLGGDEFVLLLPGCPIERAGLLTTQLITFFRQHVGTALPKPLQADLSIGMASLVRDGAQTGMELLEKADENLYAAKRAGKGQCVGM